MDDCWRVNALMGKPSRGNPTPPDLRKILDDFQKPECQKTQTAEAVGSWEDGIGSFDLC